MEKGEGRTKVMLSAQFAGTDVILHLYNENPHIGAVAVGEYDPGSQRTSTSVITRPGHKDDAVAREAAYQLSKFLKKPTCVIVGIHVDQITHAEISEIQENARALVDEFIKGGV
ncbi:MAG: hypothetical protein ACLFVK_01800 [Dehalococcoidia bacterium]